MRRRWVVLALCVAAVAAAMSLRRGDRPAAYPLFFAKDVVRRWTEPAKERPWDGTWKGACRTKAEAEAVADGEQRRLDCPARLDMRIRPLMQGTLDEALTQKTRAGGKTDACCYRFATFGNR